MAETETKQEKLVLMLKELRKVSDIEGSAAVSRDGLIIAADLSKDVDEETFAAMSATMLGAAETATTELGKGIPQRIIVESENGKLIATGAGQKALLVVMTEPDAALGLILIEVTKASEKIKEVLG